MEAFTGDEGCSPLSTLRHKGVRVAGSVIAKNVDQLGQPGERGKRCGSVTYRYPGLL